jgi:hypothetical protein
MLNRRVCRRNGGQLALDLYVPRRLAMRGVKGGEGDGGRVKSEELGFVTVGIGTTLGSRGGDGDTGQRDEKS